jgi:hypothetical protein
VISLKIALAGGQLEYEKKKLKAVMRAAGNEVAADARSLLRSSVGSGRTYRGGGGSKYRPYRKGAYQASAPGQPPVRVTGTLAGGIVVLPFRSGEGVAIRNRVYYDKFLEFGAVGGRPGKRNIRRDKGRTLVRAVGSRVLLPRPSLTVALANRAASIETRIAASIADDIKFVPQKIMRPKTNWKRQP